MLRYLTPARLQTQKDREIIEDEADEILLDVDDSTETDSQEQGRGLDHGSLMKIEDDDYNAGKPSAKRRKISLSLEDKLDVEGDSAIENYEGNFTSSIPILSSPPAPRHSKAPRFIFSTPAPQTASQATEASQTFLKPPRFRPPDPSSTQQIQTDPLPEHFSPHRRGQKYVPSGLAAEVRDWLVNLESTLPSTSTQKKDRENDPWLVKVLVDEISGNDRDGMALVRGRQVLATGNGKMVAALESVRVILAGEGQHAGLQKGAPLAIGKTIGIKGPVWEVVLEGMKWGVGVDWKVLL